MFCNGKDAFRKFIIQLLREEKGKMYGKKKHVGWESGAFLLGILSVEVSRMLPTWRARGQGKGEDQDPQHDSRMATAHPHLGGRWDGHKLERALGWVENQGLQLDGHWDGHSPSTAQGTA